jgi:ribonuclease E
MVGLNLLRQIEARAAKSRLERVRIELHPELADALQNGRRRQIASIEEEFGLRIEIIASNRLHRPEQVIEWHEKSGERREAEQQVKGQRSEVKAGEKQAKGPKGRRKAGEVRGPKGDKQTKQVAPPLDDFKEPELDDVDNFDDFDGEDEQDVMAPPQPAHADGTVQPAEKKGRRRRRRRRGKGGGDAQGAQANGATSGQAHPDDDSDELHEGARAALVVDPSAAPIPLTFDWGAGAHDDDLDDDHDDHDDDDDHDGAHEGQEAAPASNGDGTEAGRTAKRRRRRGGRGRSRRREGAPNPAAAPSEPGAPPVEARIVESHETPDAAGGDEHADGDAAPEAGKPHKKRRRRGGRGRKKTDAPAGGVSSPTHES